MFCEQVRCNTRKLNKILNLSNYAKRTIYEIHVRSFISKTNESSERNSIAEARPRA